MKRRHLFELEDQQWFPSFIRNFGTDFLQFISNKADFYQAVVPIIKKGIEESGSETVIDLAAGGGGGWQRLSEHLKPSFPDLKIILTDYFPNISAFQEMQKRDAIFQYETASVNALDVPPSLKGFRTQFLSFHHFKEAEALQILQNAVNNKVPIGIFEGQERTIGNLIKNLFSPIFILLTTPFIRPFKLSRILFTYIIPIVPLFVMWDGAVSVLRTYTPEEMKAMTQQLEGGDQYSWEIGTTKEKGILVQYLLGYPKK